MNAAQVAWNAKQEVRIDYQQREIDRLYSLTRIVVPNENLNPGVGPVQVVPVPPSPAPVPTLDVAAITAAVVAAMSAQNASTKPASQQGQ